MELCSGVPITNVRKRDVPAYLQLGDFYKSLNDDDPQELIPVPANTLKPTKRIKNEIDLVHLLCSLRFWMVTDVCMEILEYMLENDVGNEVSPFHPDMHYLVCIQDVTRMHASRTAANMSYIDCALEQGHLSIVKLLHQRGDQWGARATTSAVQGRNLECLRYVHAHHAKLQRDTFERAVSIGHLPCLEYLHEHKQGRDAFEDYACVAAAAGGHLDCLQYLHTHGYPWDSMTTSDAALHGQLACLEYAHENSCPWGASTWGEAAEGKHLHILHYLAEKQCPWQIQIMRDLVQSGDVAGVEMLNQVGCAWDGSVCAVAAHCRNLEMLTFLRTNGCPWDERTCENAIRYDSYECLIFAVENGCPLSARAFQFAILGRNSNILNYLRDHNCTAVVQFNAYESAQENPYL